mmetsp:Transcript_26485/g.34342  ORF Transcript_26485/g.34342 Transcript_26485/m.34342 type:complete len:437 (-) Transcript_26485:253-1563(-)
MAFSSRRRNYLLTGHKRDPFIEWMKEMLSHSFVLDCVEDTIEGTMEHFESLFFEHYTNPTTSKFSQLVPTAKPFFTPLPMLEAWQMYDAKYKVSKRKFVHCSFNEIRHILNLAQVLGQREKLKFMSFDGDCTLYQDGEYFDNPKIAYAIRKLLENGVSVALITAAGYGYDSEKYEQRLSGLLEYFRKCQLPEEVMSRFYVVGGECNFLLQCGSEAKLQPIQAEVWKPDVLTFSEEDIQALLDTAEGTIREAIEDLQLQVRVIRKARAVGIIPGGSNSKREQPNGHGANKVNREHLDEVVLRVQHALRQSGNQLPFCAFNGGNDAFVDIGDKSIGVQGLQRYLGLSPDVCMHVGDQFLSTGNDIAARSVCPTIWISNPRETKCILKTILKIHGLITTMDDEELHSPTRKISSTSEANVDYPITDELSLSNVEVENQL